MKVIHLISGGDTGGARTHVYSLLSYLLKKGVEVQLVCFIPGSFADGARELGIPTWVLTAFSAASASCAARSARAATTSCTATARRRISWARSCGGVSTCR